MNISIDFAEVFPNGGGGQVQIEATDFGCIAYAALSGILLEEVIIPYIMLLAAGAIAEKIFYPKYVDERTHCLDRKYAEKCYEVVVQNSHEFPPTHKEIISRAEKMLHEKKNKRLIRKIAIALFLFGKLSRAQLDKIR
jgi:hypothetical protein